MSNQEQTEFNHLLIVEDEEKIAGIVKDYASKQFKKVTVIGDGNKVLPFINGLEQMPEVVILDLMLPGKGGLEICQELRKAGNMVPIIMLTARSEEDDKLQGLDSGADDYVSKPFSPRELMARVNALVRRSRIEGSNEKDGVVTCRNLTMKLSTHELTVGGQLVELTPNEFGLLHILMAHPNKVFSRYELLQKVMGYEYEGYDRTIDTHIKNIRKKISLNGNESNYIKTIYGVGYKFLPDA